MTTAPASIIIGGLIYRLDNALHKIPLREKITGCSEEWYEKNGVRSWLCQSPKKQWFQVIVSWNEGPEGKLLSKKEAVLLHTRFFNRSMTIGVFGKSIVKELEG